MKTAQQQKVELTFECMNCLQLVTERMHKLHAEMIKHSGSGCCDACCNQAEAYYASPVYQAFEEAENNFDYYA